MGWKIILILVVLWAYRRIGILSYQLRNVSSEYERTKVDYPSGPNLLLFLVRGRFGGRLTWLFSWTNQFDYTNWRDARSVKCLLKTYSEIYGWPYLWVKGLYHEFRFRILLKYHTVFRTREKELLKNEMFGKFRTEIKNALRGFSLIGVKSSDGRYELILKLPGKTIQYLGPWGRPSPDEPCFRYYGLLSAFQDEAWKKLHSGLRLPYEYSSKIENTREVIVEVGTGHFCGHPFWGDFKPEKWEGWKKDFIEFFRNVPKQTISC